MADLPEASVTIDDEAGAFAGGTGYAVVIGCVEQNDDITPRVFASTKALLTQHGYSPAVDYCALHLEKTKKPIIFVGLPKATAGTLTRQSGHLVTGTSVVSVAAGANGVLEEVDAVLTVITGGTIGANGIVFDLSLDGNRTKKRVRLGTASSYTIPYVGIVISFAAGTLIAGDVYTFESTAPMWNNAGLTAAREALAEQLKLARTWLVVGDVTDSTVAGYVVTQVNAYETSNDRFVVARVQTKDIVPRVVMTTGGNLTFAEVGGTGDTITRASGSWLTDGFRVGDRITVSGTVSNNFSDALVTAVTATVLTLDTQDLTAEVIASSSVTLTKGQTMSAFVSANDSDFASIDAQKRVDLGLGRARKVSPITGWNFRRPAAWAASIREYEHDVHIPVWRKSDGPLDGWSLEDADGNIVEFDERTDGGGLAGRFTCFRTYGNGPRGSFVALSLTRATEGSLLSRTHNMQVANLACTVCHAETENAIGQVLVLNADGTGSDASLSVIESRVNSSLERALLQDRGEGPRASRAVWKASRTDVLNVPGAELTGTLDLLLNGTLEKITTRVRVQTAG